MSLRSDLLPPEMCEEFKCFFDQVEAVLFDDVRKEFERELGKPIDSVFAEFQSVPLAVASLGQVHRAKLKDGTDVAVKIQRPGVHALIQNDIAALFIIARLLKRYTKFSLLDPVAVVQELEDCLRCELDYRNEAQAADKFRERHADDPMIVTPRIYWELTGERVLTSEFIKGHKVLDIMRATERHDTAYLRRLRRQKINVTEACEYLTYHYMKQVIVDGYFHADPHPANLLLLPGNRIAFIDFGIVGTLSGEFQETALKWLQAVILQHPEEAVEALLQMSSDVSHAKKAEMIKEVRLAMERLHLSNYSLSLLCCDILRTALSQHLVLPPFLLLAVKGMTLIEGVTVRLAPDSDCFETTNRSFRSILLLLEEKANGGAGSYGTALLGVVFGHVTDYVNAINKMFLRYHTAASLKGGDRHGSS